MTEIKTLQQLTKETTERDAVLIDTIKTAIATAIDTAVINDEEYKVIYNINAALSTAGSLQKTRIKNFIQTHLKNLGYKAFYNEQDALEITWIIATLYKA